MSGEKYNILVKNNFTMESSPAKTEDLSLALESSLILSGTKYPEPKTRLRFNFISTSRHSIIKLFFITISYSKPNGVYYGFDASERCVVISSIQLEVGRRYEIYGRLRKERTIH